MASGKPKRVVFRVVFVVGALMTMFGVWGLFEGILTLHVHHGAVYVIIGSFYFLLPGLAMCAVSWSCLRTRRESDGFKP